MYTYLHAWSVAKRRRNVRGKLERPKRFPALPVEREMKWHNIAFILSNKRARPPAMVITLTSVLFSPLQLRRGSKARVTARSTAGACTPQLICGSAIWNAIESKDLAACVILRASFSFERMNRDTRALTCQRLSLCFRGERTYATGRVYLGALSLLRGVYVPFGRRPSRSTYPRAFTSHYLAATGAAVSISWLTLSLACSPTRFHRRGFFGDIIVFGMQIS